MHFPNSSQLAHFNPRSQIVFLDTIDMRVFEDDFKNRRSSNIRKPISIMYHEVTHWADFVGTLWGNSYLKKLYSCYEILPFIRMSGSEYKFYRFLDVHDQDRRISYGEYYRVQGVNARRHSHVHTWRIEFSCGLEFNTSGRLEEKLPIIFVTFRDRDSGKLVVRQPLSIASLLETTAVWSEIVAQISAINSIEGPEKVIDMRFMETEMLRHLYAEDLTLYSVAVHLLAHYTGIKETIDAYRLGAFLSFICLNLTGLHFRKIKAPVQMAEWAGRVGAMRISESVPFAYHCICANGPKWVDGLSTTLGWIEEALANSDLPSFDEIMSNAVKVLSEDTTVCSNPKLGEAQSYLREIGSRWLVERVAMKDPAIGLHQAHKPGLCTPPMFDSEGERFLLFDSKFDISKFDAMHMYDLDAKLHTQILNLRRSCR